MLPQIAIPPLDARLGGLAAAQHGLVALEQVRLLGLTDSAVRKRVASGRLHRVHRGVYAVGRPGLAAPGRWLAAVMACGPGAALSHRSAAALLGLTRGDPDAPDVTTRNRSGRTLDGVTAHCDPRLSPDDLTAVAGIPCTTVPRTLLDLAASVDRQTLERAVEQAEVLRVFDGRALARVLADANGRRGGSRLRAVLAAGADPTITRSELEERFLALCRGAGLPHPRVNTWISLDGGGVEADFAWPAHRLVIETDGHGSHGTRRAFERDRPRPAARPGRLACGQVHLAAGDGGARRGGVDARRAGGALGPPTAGTVWMRVGGGRVGARGVAGLPANGLLGQQALQALDRRDRGRVDAA